MRTALLISLGLAAVAPAQTSHPTSKATSSQPSSQATSRPAKKMATGSKDALALAKRVFDFAGGEAGWAKVRNLVFTFKVPGMRRRILWDRAANKIRVEPLGRRASYQASVYDFATKKATRFGGNGRRSNRRNSPLSIWINDTYWLLVPLKVLDPGVRLSIDDPVEGDAKTVQRLRLRFDKVGQTPQNEYVLHVENKTGRVVRWDFYASAAVRPRSWQFEDYKDVGPLKLSLRRPMAGARGGFTISLVDVAINLNLPKSIWTNQQAVLGGLGTAKQGR